MISRGRVAVVLGRRGLSILLLAVGVLIAFLVTLRAVPSEAQADCREVASIGPETTNQRVGPVQIRGDTIRVEGEVTAEDPDRFSALSIDLEGEGEDGLPAFDFVSITETGPFQENILEGPGSYTFNIESTEAVTYTVTISDCGESPPGDTSTPQGDPSTPVPRAIQEQKGKIIPKTIPRRRLPPTGGLSTYAMVTGSILVGAGLLGLGLVVRRGSRD